MKKILLIVLACVFLISGNVYALTMTVTFEDGSERYPAGKYFPPRYSDPADTDDPLGPFFNQSIYFKGADESGGKELIYRYRIEFDETVNITSISILSYNTIFAPDERYKCFKFFKKDSTVNQKYAINL